jgi:hypothetical protein
MQAREPQHHRHTLRGVRASASTWRVSASTTGRVSKNGISRWGIFLTLRGILRMGWLGSVIT